MTVSLGLTDWLTFTNAFAFRKYLYRTDNTHYLDNEPNSPPETNGVFREQATATFNVSPKKRLSLSYLFAAQKDDVDYRNGELRRSGAVRNWMIHFLYQGELDS